MAAPTPRLSAPPALDSRRQKTFPAITRRRNGDFNGSRKLCRHVKKRLPLTGCDKREFQWVRDGFSVPGSTKQLDLFLSRSNARECFILSSSSFSPLSSSSSSFPSSSFRSLPGGEGFQKRSSSSTTPLYSFSYLSLCSFFALP